MIGLAFKDGNGYSVYPLNPVTALFSASSRHPFLVELDASLISLLLLFFLVNTIAAGPPALALGLEPTASDAMLKGPTAFKTIFTLHWWMDLIFYGVLVRPCSLSSSLDFIPKLTSHLSSFPPFPRWVDSPSPTSASVSLIAGSSNRRQS